MRAEIRAIPNGVYEFEDVIEDDGISDRSYPMQLRLTVRDDDVIADFTGSAAQAVGPVNAIYAVTASAVYNAILHLTDPTIPRNEGCYRPITVIAPPGTIVNCTFPAPVAGGNTETSPAHHRHGLRRAAARPFRSEWSPPAAAPLRRSSSAASIPRSGDLYAHFHFEGVGWGGRKGSTATTWS